MNVDRIPRLVIRDILGFARELSNDSEKNSATSIYIRLYKYFQKARIGSRGFGVLLDKAISRIGQKNRNS